MISIFQYLSARQSVKFSNRLIEEMGGEDRVDPYLLAQKDMHICATTYYYYRCLAETIYLLLFVAVCVIIYGVTDEEDLRTLWSGISSWYAHAMAWGQLQAETIYQSISSYQN